MGALAREGAKDNRYLRLAARMLVVPYWNQPAVIDAYVRGVFTYEDEAIETLKAPERIMDEIDAFGDFTGDCDDASIFLATIFKSMGLQSQFVAIRQYEAEPDYTHVFVEALFPGLGLKRFDPTVPPYTEHEFVEAMAEYV